MLLINFEICFFLLQHPFTQLFRASAFELYISCLPQYLTETCTVHTLAVGGSNENNTPYLSRLKKKKLKWTKKKQICD